MIVDVKYLNNRVREYLKDLYLDNKVTKESVPVYFEEENMKGISIIRSEFYAALTSLKEYEQIVLTILLQKCIQI